MIRKPEGYDEAQAYTGEGMSLPAGCYVCEILGAIEENYNGRERFVMQFDIAEGECKGFYQQQFKAAKERNVSAKYKGEYRQVMDGSSVPFFKGLITSIEKSNPGYSFPWNLEGNEKTLKGKKFGAVMGREQFLTNDGEKRFATKIFQIRSLDGLKDAKVPEDRLLTEEDLARWNREHGIQQKASDPSLAADGFMNIPDGIDEELPFM